MNPDYYDYNDYQDPDRLPWGVPLKASKKTACHGKRQNLTRRDKGKFTVSLTVAQKQEVIDAYVTRKEQGLTAALIGAAMGISERTVHGIK